MRITATGDQWWRTAVVYCLDVERFLDLNGDGVGDLPGLAHRLDYLADLGVTCLWLMPFYPSPRRDNGYDIADFYGVDPRFGHLGEMVEIIRTAHDRGMRLIVDLVINHTSDEHPWFESARGGPHEPFHDYYLWRDTPPESDADNMFPELEDGVWSFDPEAGRHYRHAFFAHQPDLNTQNPHVRDQLAKVVGFWLQLGVDGFRLDAVDHAVEDGTEHGHELLKSIHDTMARRHGAGMLLGEVNLPHDEQVTYFGHQGDELTMQFDFASNQQMFLSLARHDARPLAASLAQRPPAGEGTQWANFVRNHDEVNLDLLSRAEAAEVLGAFAPDPDHRFHDRGIVRRLPGMLDHHPARIAMVYSLLFSLPGTPVLLYGEEIGLAESPRVRGREAVRPLMRWSSSKHAGFSNTSDPERLVAPCAPSVASDVVEQLNDPDSLLNLIRTLAYHYRRAPEIGWGEPTILDHACPAVLAHEVRGEIGRTVALHNFGPEPQQVSLTLTDVPATAHARDVFDRAIVPLDTDRLTVELDGFGFRWFHVLRDGEERLL